MVESEELNNCFYYTTWQAYFFLKTFTFEVVFTAELKETVNK